MKGAAVLYTLLQFAVCAVIIVVAGTFLTQYADAIAEITKLGRLVVGSVLLAGATSLPELTVDISAVRMGLADLAVGDLLEAEVKGKNITLTPKSIIDREIALGLADFKRGRFLGPFRTAKAAVRALRRAAK